jgi:hypothetical protein
MADIDMTDAPSRSGSAPVKKSIGKGKAAGAEGASDGKKRFEVKKVGALLSELDDCVAHSR